MLNKRKVLELKEFLKSQLEGDSRQKPPKLLIISGHIPVSRKLLAQSKAVVPILKDLLPQISKTSAVAILMFYHSPAIDLNLSYFPWPQNSKLASIQEYEIPCLD